MGTPRHITQYFCSKVNELSERLKYSGSASSLGGGVCVFLWIARIAVSIAVDRRPAVLADVGGPEWDLHQYLQKGGGQIREEESLPRVIGHELKGVHNSTPDSPEGWGFGSISKPTIPYGHSARNRARMRRASVLIASPSSVSAGPPGLRDSVE